MIRIVWILLAAGSLWGQTAAGVLVRLDGVRWESAPSSACVQRVPAQLDVYATVEWTDHCTDTRNGVIRETFYYVFGEPARIALMRVDLRAADESPENTARLLPLLRRALRARFGEPVHDPELMEIGFRHLRFGQPVSGDHWKGGGLHYFLHANQSAATPMGVRHGVQLVVLTDRLYAERMQDAMILRAEGIFGEAQEDDDPVRARLKARIGAPYVRALRAQSSPSAVRETAQDLTAILRESDGAGPARRALCLLAADQVANKLSQWLTEGSPETGSVRRLLARYGAKLGGMTHYGGLEYRHELLWRVWREWPDTEGGELAFLGLLGGGFSTGPGEGCPPNPDLFHEVIERGEAFLASHPRTDFRRQVLYALAQANESWWSIGHAPKDDPWVNAPPYPRRAENARTAAGAREEAIRYYREVARMDPGSPEAASALRRLPRLELGLDTGQRRFFCSYC
jgi:hypothetical protein